MTKNKHNRKKRSVPVIFNMTEPVASKKADDNLWQIIYLTHKAQLDFVVKQSGYPILIYNEHGQYKSFTPDTFFNDPQHQGGPLSIIYTTYKGDIVEYLNTTYPIMGTMMIFINEECGRVNVRYSSMLTK